MLFLLQALFESNGSVIEEKNDDIFGWSEGVVVASELWVELLLDFFCNKDANSMNL